MKFSASLVAAAAIGLSIASPVVEKRNHTIQTPTIDDAIILNYALTLEYLERKFYAEALERFSEEDFVKAGFLEPFYKNLNEIYLDEQIHVTFIQQGLEEANITATTELEYNFGFTDVKSFVTLSSVLEGVGVSAYLGAAASIVDPGYLTAAGAILSVEARHNAYIRSALKESPFPAPFDTPLEFVSHVSSVLGVRDADWSQNKVFSLAAAFIVGGSSPVEQPFKAFPSLALRCSKYYYEAGHSSLTFSGAFTAAKKFDAAITKETEIYAVFFSGLEKFVIQVRISGKDYKINTIPVGIQGQTYVVLSRSDTIFSDEYIIAGPAILEVYPKGKTPAAALPKCS